MNLAPVVRLGDYVTIRGGGTPRRDIDRYFLGQIPWITPKDMKVWELYDSELRLTEEALRNSTAVLVPADTVLLVVRSGVLKHTVPVAINRVPVAINQDMKSLECHPALNSDYLARLLKAAQPTILSWVRATTADNYSIDKIRELPIPLPSLDEQRRIAAILDQADELRRTRRLALDKLNELPQAIFYDMFGDPIDNPNGYPTLPLETLIDDSRGISYGIVQRGLDQTHGVNVFRISDIEDGRITTTALKKTTVAIAAKHKRTTLRGGEIIISIRGTIGRCAIVPRNLAGSNVSRELAVLPLIGSTTSTEFLIHLLRAAPVQRRLTRDVKGVAQSGINLQDLRKLPVIQPPHQLVTTFVALLTEQRTLAHKTRTHLRCCDQLFASLQHHAFAGTLTPLSAEETLASFLRSDLASV